MRTQNLKEYIRRNWIKELSQQGVTQGPDGEPLQSLDYGDLLRLKVRQEVRDEGQEAAEHGRSKNTALSG